MRLTQITDFFPLVCSFFARRAEKEHKKEEKYHAAAGYKGFCVSPIHMGKIALVAYDDRR
jgi:hypothetical protein